MLRIAITGGIAEGKSTVLEMFRKQGHSVGSADEVAKLVRNLPEVQAELALITGLPTPLDPEDLRAAIAANASWRRAVNSAMHRRVLAEMVQQDRQIWEVPLLVESVLTDKFFRTVVVTCGPEMQRARLVERVVHEELADQLLASQLPTQVKLPFADFIVRTDCPMDDVLIHVAELSHGLGFR